MPASISPPSGHAPPAQTGRIDARRRARAISRLSYGAVIAVLVFSMFQAYEMQGTLSQQSLEIYRQYVQQDELLSRLRQRVWQGSVYARDFFLSADATRASILKSQVDELRQESAADIVRLEIPGGGAEEVRAMLTEFWATLDQVADSMEGVAGPNAYEFINREIVPRRSAANMALLELRRASHAAVEDSELEFVKGRQAAGRKILFLLAFSVLIGVVVAVVSIRRTERLEEDLLRNYETVAEAKRELQQLSNRLIEIQEEERGRLSRELHDEIGQILTAVRIEISRSLSAAGAASPEAAERLARARELMERAVKTVRNISLLLRPSALDDFGLIAALQWQVEDFSRRSGIPCEFVEDGVADALPDAVKTCAYRAVQEALHNCEKHSAASSVHIRITQLAEALDIAIEDDGRGVDLGSAGLPLKREGSGLLGMRERIAFLGGELAIRSSQGAGFKLSIRIPFGTGSAQKGAAAAGGENA